MTEVVKSLFGIDPQQVLAARDAQMSQQALQFARLSPMQQSQMGIYQGASRLGNAAAGMMGGQDPELQRVSQRNALMQGVDPTNPEHLKAAAMKATEMGDYAAAQEIAARFQALQTASADQAYKRAQMIRALTEAEKATLEKATPEMRNAAAIAAAQTGAQKGSPEFDKTYLETLKELTAKKGDRFGQDNEAEAMAAFGKPFGELTQEEQRKVLESVNSEKGKRAKAAGTTVNNFAPGVSLDPKKTGESAGKVVGEAIGEIENKYSAIDSVRDAVKILDGGIFSGFWGKSKMAVRKAMGENDPKVVNTEKFLAYVGEVVIPRLKDFGGNDSNEEMKYLQKVLAGDQSLESNSMKAILSSAERKIQRGIERVQRQSKATAEGKPAPLDPGPNRQAAPGTKENPIKLK